MGLKRKLINIIVSFVVLSCRSEPKVNSDSTSLRKSDTLEVLVDTSTLPIKVSKQSDFEYIDIDSVSINGVPFYGKRDFLEATLKMADSINDYGYECGSALQEQNDIYYYELDEIEVSLEKYAFRVVYFDSKKGNAIFYKKLIFNSNYSVGDFQNDFPNSYIKNSDAEGETIEVHVASNVTFENDITWRFYFENGKLSKLWYFISC